jgi:NAD(P)-dependent dehydrogenase (short-subunit alcohol dehydrogenase family)
MHPTRKTWFITGASSGFGHAYASHALARDYNVVATARNVGRLQRLVAQAPDRVLALKLDVDCSDDARAAIDAAVGRFGQIDVLINNAGYGVIGALEETPDTRGTASSIRHQRLRPDRGDPGGAATPAKVEGPDRLHLERQR